MRKNMFKVMALSLAMATLSTTAAFARRLSDDFLSIPGILCYNLSYYEDGGILWEFSLIASSTKTMKN